ncbi:hypothetical protein IJ670_02880 [bacterium]|nr:hypothetical protein [bacterium]
MVLSKLKAIIFFAILMLFCVIAIQLPQESSLVGAILPKNIQNYNAIVKLASNTNSTISVIFEAKDKEELENLRQEFLIQTKEHIKLHYINFSELLKQYQKSPDIFLSDKTKKLLEQKKYNEILNSAQEKLYNPVFVPIAEFEDDPYFLLEDFLNENMIKNPVKYYENKYYLVEEYQLNQKYNNKIFEKAKENCSKYGNIYFSGIPVHSFYTQKEAVVIINLACILMTVLILALTYYSNRSLKPVLFAFLSILFGYLGGFFALKIFFKSFHILTLVFTTVLIGIGIDYTYHYLYKEDNDLDFQKNLTLSFISTSLAFLVLYFSGIQIMRQISVFIIMGLFCIYLFVLWVYPLVDFSKSKKSFNIKFNKIILVLLVLVSFLGLFNVKFDNSLKAFYSAKGELKYAQELQYKLNSNNFKIYLLKASSLQNLLQKEEKILKNNSQILSYSKFMPSLKTQKENDVLVKDLYKNNLKNYAFFPKDKINSLLNKKRTFFEGIQTSLSNYFLLNEKESFIYSKTKIEDKEVTYLDFQGEISKYLKQYSKNLLILLPLVFVLLFIVLFFNYKKKAFKMLLPSIFGVFCSVGIFGLLNQKLTMFSLIALFLILGFTIDYSIFKEQGSKNAKDAVFISCITTSFSFLVLSFSSFKFISSISLILFVGIITSYICGCFLFEQETETM